MAKFETSTMEHAFMKIQYCWSINKTPRRIGWSNESCTNVKAYQNVQPKIYKLPKGSIVLLGKIQCVVGCIPISSTKI
jgi:hypothetical protein